MARAKERVFESTKAAAAALNIDIGTIKKARDLGCPAFEAGNRIRGGVLEKWIADHADELKASGANLSLKDQKTNEEIRKLKIANDQKERQLVRRSDVASAVAGTIEGVKAILEQKLRNEYPSAVAGMDVAGARVYGTRVIDATLTEFQGLHKLWKI